MSDISPPSSPSSPQPLSFNEEIEQAVNDYEETGVLNKVTFGTKLFNIPVKYLTEAQHKYRKAYAQMFRDRRKDPNYKKKNTGVKPKYTKKQRSQVNYHIGLNSSLRRSLKTLPTLNYICNKQIENTITLSLQLHEMAKKIKNKENPKPPTEREVLIQAIQAAQDSSSLSSSTSSSSSSSVESPQSRGAIWPNITSLHV